MAATLRHAADWNLVAVSKQPRILFGGQRFFRLIAFHRATTISFPVKYSKIAYLRPSYNLPNDFLDPCCCLLAANPVLLEDRLYP